jgi:hypothetical protein
MIDSGPGSGIWPATGVSRGRYQAWLPGLIDRDKRKNSLGHFVLRLLSPAPPPGFNSNFHGRFTNTQNRCVKTDFISNKYRSVKYHAINSYRYAAPARETNRGVRAGKIHLRH